MTEGKLRVDALQSVVEAAKDLAEQMGIGFILRIQDKKEAMVNINNGVTEEIATTSLRGMGIQVFSADGYSGFASSDRVNPEEVRTLLRQAVCLADKVKEVAGEKNRAVFGLSPPSGAAVAQSEASIRQLILEHNRREIDQNE